MQRSKPAKPPRSKGIVREYEPGKTITIVIRPQVAQTYDLTDKDTRYEIGPGVTPGSKVVAAESRDAEGRKVVCIFVKP